VVGVHGALLGFRRDGPVGGEGAAPDGEEEDFDEDEGEDADAADDLDEAVLPQAGAIVK
jgi:hypothetical protein